MLKLDKKFNAKKIIWMIITILYVLFIFSNSLQVAEDSSKRSQGILMFIRQNLPFLQFVSEYMIRKTAHFTEFMILGLLLSKCNEMQLQAKLFLIGILVAMSDETIQLFVPGRSGQVTDVWIDFAGVCVGLVLSSLLFGHNSLK